MNGTGQTGAAVVAQTPAGLSVSVEVAVDDVHQLAAIAHGSCAELGLLYALIDADLALQRPDGLFRTDAVTRFEDAAPVTLEELASGSFAVVVADFETRSGGLVEALPAGTRLLEGPSGWETTPLAACGDIPAG